MKSSRFSIVIFIILFIISPIFAQQEEEDQSVDVDGYKVSYSTFNIDNRKKGEPILVFEPGLGGGTFAPVLPFFPSDVSGIQYERSGVGKSELDPEIETDSQLSERLYNLLTVLHIEPPYLLVGHSIGGAYIRLFAAKYPDKVCGLVFIDPTDFMLSSEEDEKARITSGSDTGYQKLSKVIFNQMMENENFPSGVRNDAARALKANNLEYFQEYLNLPDLKKSIAATVIISYNKYIEQPDIELNENLKLGIDFKPWWKAYDDLRIAHFTDLIRENDNSMIVLLPKYSHGIYYQNPKLVAELILENFNSHQRVR